MVMCHQNYLDQFFRFAVKCANLGMHAFTSSPGMDIPCSGETLRAVQVLEMGFLLTLCSFNFANTRNQFSFPCTTWDMLQTYDIE